jgi:LPS-assembly protein
LRGVGRYWNLQLMADDFQVIDESVSPDNEPYRRLPRLAYWSDRPLTNSGLSLAVDAEVVYFHREVGTTGARADFLPMLYWDLQERWGFLKPSVGYRYTTYDLDPEDPAAEDSPSTGVPIASLDSGLVFRPRATPTAALQTLEPRLFYLYVPFERHRTICRVFDTAPYTFGFSQLFNTNRFAGAQIGRAMQTRFRFAVSTRNYDSTHSGDVRWSLSLGQIFFFESLEVTLDDAPGPTNDLSPFIAEFNWRPFSRFSARTGLQWDWDQNRFDVGSLGVSYSGDQRPARQFRLPFPAGPRRPVRPALFVAGQRRMACPVARELFVRRRDDLLEVQAGFEYESCCWALRTVLRRYLKNRDGDFRDGIYLELSLKGLASIGTRTLDLFNY